MSASQSIRDIFFEECEDLLEALIEGLAEMADGVTDDDTVNAVFRAVHSIKGGAGAFGLDELVAFAHTFETLLDQVRSGKVDPEPSLVSTLQKAGDILSDLVEAAREEAEPDSQAAEAMLETLRTLLGQDEEQEPEEVFEFQPLGLALDLDIGDEAETETRYAITFSPHRDLHAVGHEPLILFRALAELGTIGVKSALEEIPDLDAFDCEEPFLSWKITLDTVQPEEAVREIFEFVDGLCDLEIEADIEDDKACDYELPPEETKTAPVVEDVPAVKPAPETTASRRETRDTLRVDVGRIDRLINLVGELIVNQAMIAQRFDELHSSDAPDILTDLEDYKQLARDIQEGVMSLRTQPVRPLFQRMSRIVREAADGVGKSVRLVTEGEWTEVDKKVTEKLSDPLTHMIRNSIDHGIELSDKRLAAGKAEQGTVKLAACHKSGNVLITVSDDGAGLNRKRIFDIAVEKGLVDADAVLNNQEIDELLFLPGFSTAKEVTNLSGRGVGMDVVRTAISALGGRINISSTPGEGTIFSIQLPLTLAVLDGMEVEIGTQTLIVPISNILEAIRPGDNDVNELGSGHLVLKNRGAYLPVIDLATCLGMPPSEREVDDQVLLVVTANNKLVALAVDAVRDQRQVVIKSLTGNYGQIPGISAATILGDGSVALIVDPDGVSNQANTSSPDFDRHKPDLVQKEAMNHVEA